ncbi:MAG: hypothetical protein R3279_05665 [Putridiphycobacter sp.]|nr:hypothetical protein [Putridiphycobacter sp.]
MFENIEIAAQNNGIVLSTTGQEYEICEAFSTDYLLIDQLLVQLKISTIRYGYSVYQNKLILLKECDLDMELYDDTIRFDFNHKMIINKNDIYLLNRYLELVNESVNGIEIFVRFGKKNHLFFDYTVQGISTINHRNRLKRLAIDIEDEAMLQQRFKVLLNNTFLNKLKTYFALWKQKHQVAYELPNWFQKLYT